MRKSIYVMLIAAGITLVTGCMSLEEIKAARAKAEAERKEARAKAAAERFVETKNRADAGDGEMAYRTGIMLEKGIGVKADPQQAFVYYEKAVKAGRVTASWQIMNKIYKARDTEHSKLFGDCYEVVWTKILFPNIHSLETQSRVVTFKSHEAFEKSYRNGVNACLNYLELLQKAGKDKEAYALKTKLISIICNRPSGDRTESNLPYRVSEFLKKLEKIETNAEKQIAEEKCKEKKRIAESKFRELEHNEQKKFPNRKLGKGIRIYKDIYAGSSLEWIKCKTAISGQEICKDTIFRPIFLDEFLPEIPKNWQGNEFRRTYTIYDGDKLIRYIFAGKNNEQTMIGCEISLRGVSPKNIVEKYKKEFPGLKISEKVIDDTRCIFMFNQKVRIQVTMILDHVPILIADQKYIDLYRNVIQEAKQKADQKTLDF